MSELGYLFSVAIDHPLVVGIVAGDGAYAPREVHLLVALVEHALQVGSIDNGRVDGHRLADDITVVGKGVARVCAIKTRVHLIVAYIRGCGHSARPTAVIHPEHRVADVLAGWIIGYQLLTIAVVGKVRGVGGLFFPLRRLRGEVLMDENIGGYSSSFVRVDVATVRAVAPRDGDRRIVTVFGIAVGVGCCRQAGHHALAAAVLTKVLAVAGVIKIYIIPVRTSVEVAVELAVVGRHFVVGTTVRGKRSHFFIRRADVGNVARIGVGSATGLVGNVDVPATVTLVEVLLEDGPPLVGVLVPQVFRIKSADTTTEDYHVGNVRLRLYVRDSSNEHHEHEQ